MRGLCGWFSGRPLADGEGTLRRMLQANHAPTQDAALRTAGGAGLAIFGAAARPRLLESDGMMLAVVGHPRLRADGRRVDDDAALLQALQARGKDALADIGGDFALASWDGRRERG